MRSNTRIPKAEITGLYGAVLKKMSKKMFGEVPEALGVMWHNRPVLKVSMGLGHKVSKWKECDKDLKSYAHMAVAALIGCSFCLDLGYFQAHNEGLDEAKARDVPRWRESDVFTSLEREVRSRAKTSAGLDVGVGRPWAAIATARASAALSDTLPQFVAVHPRDGRL